MIKSILSLPLYFFCTIILAQPSIQWQKAFGGTKSEEAYSIHQTEDGGYIVAGTTSSNDGDVFGNHGTVDFWVLKLDSTGSVQWKKPYGGGTDEQASAIQQTADRGYIVVGYTLSNTWDVSGNHGYYDGWVLKLDSLGGIQWQRCLGGSDWDEAYDVQQTSDGGYIVAGHSRSTDGDVTVNHGDLDYWLVKLDSMGNLEWQRSHGGSHEDIAYAVSQTSDGGYIVAGEAFSIDGDVTGNHGGSDCWVVKLNYEGKIEWEKSLGGTSIDRGNDILQSRNGGYVAFGQTYSNNGDVTGNHGANDFWAVKLGIDGDIEWKEAYGGSNEDFGRSISQTSDGGYVMTGMTQSNNGDVLGNDGGADVWVLKISELGELQWQKTFGGTQAEGAHSIQQTTDGGYVFAGFAWSNNGDVSGMHGYGDFWVVKLSPESSPTSSPQALILELFPNPAINSISLKIPTEEPILSVSITDLLGREIKSETITNGGNANISALTNGLYLLRATTGSGRVYSGKFRKQE
ncbi:MAG: T9SS type A sorting domain-containing protein [Saprospiraceae bacterium]